MKNPFSTDDRIAYRDELLAIIKAPVYNHDAFMQKLAEKTSTEIDLVISDVLADMGRGAWREYIPSRPSGGSATFYKDFPQEALMALLGRASQETAIAALHTPLSSWKSARFVSNVLGCLIRFRTADEVEALVTKYPGIVDIAMCEFWLRHIHVLEGNAVMKWFILYNQSPLSSDNTLLMGKKEFTSDLNFRYHSVLDDLLAKYTVTRKVLNKLDGDHLSRLQIIAWCVNGFPRVQSLYVDTLERLPDGGHYATLSLEKMYHGDMNDDYVQRLMVGTVKHLQPRTTTSNQYPKELPDMNEYSFKKLMEKMIRDKAPESHWRIILQGVDVETRKKYFEGMLSSLEYRKTNNLEPYSPEELYNTIFRGCAPDDRYLAVALAQEALQKIGVIDMRICSEDANTIAQHILISIEDNKKWNDTFGTRLRALFPSTTAEEAMNEHDVGTSKTNMGTSLKRLSNH